MLSYKSFAKINLYLEITGKTKNNYHLLDSLMSLIDIYDIISIKESNEFWLDIKENNKNRLPVNDNIIIKAVDLLSKKHNFIPNIKITLEKNIPVSAGLGGGSSNAATMLLTLNSFYNLNLSQEQLMEYALTLGADVPFFLNGKTAFVSGIGEIIKPAQINTNNTLILLVNPNLPISTKQVFELFSKTKIVGKIDSKIHSQNSQNLLSTIKNRRNDLQKTAATIIPKINEIIHQISKQQGCLLSRISGSGPTCFGIFENEEDLNLAYKNLESIFPGFYLKRTSINQRNF
jgi:4-diphosphocytidyl-2-C-methyl-D-erythritol kinase